MLKVFHTHIESQTLLRILDNLFFGAGALFLIIGLLSSNTLLSIYGLAVMFISLFMLQFIMAKHQEYLKNNGSPDDTHKVKIAVLITQEKKLQQELVATRNTIHEHLEKIKDLSFRHRVHTKFRAELHEHDRNKKIINEDMRSLLLVYHHDLMKYLPPKEKAKFTKGRYAKLYQKVLDRVHR